MNTQKQYKTLQSNISKLSTKKIQDSKDFTVNEKVMLLRMKLAQNKLKSNSISTK